MLSKNNADDNDLSEVNNSVTLLEELSVQEVNILDLFINIYTSYSYKLDIIIIYIIFTMAWLCKMKIKNNQSMLTAGMFMTDKANVRQAGMIAVATAEGLFKV